jgi:hypothetical protein
MAALNCLALPLQLLPILLQPPIQLRQIPLLVLAAS